MVRCPVRIGQLGPFNDDPLSDLTTGEGSCQSHPEVYQVVRCTDSHVSGKCDSTDRSGHSILSGPNPSPEERSTKQGKVSSVFGNSCGY